MIKRVKWATDGFLFPRSIAICVFSTVLIFISSCDVVEPDNTIQFGLESRIIIELKQELSTQTRKLVLKCKTEKVYGQLPYRILSRWSRKGDHISLFFDGIEGYTIMADAGDHARTEINLGSLPPDNYSVSIYLSDSLVQTTLSVTEEYWEIGQGNGVWVVFPRSRLWRVPDDVIWGLTGYTSESDLPTITSYFDSIHDLGAQHGQWPSGDYGLFTINSSGNIGLPHLEPGHVIGGRHFNDWYIRRFSGPNYVLRNIVKEIGQLHGATVSVSVYLPDGEHYHSHMHATYPGY